MCAPHAVAARGRTVVCGTPPVSSAAGHVKGGGRERYFEWVCGAGVFVRQVRTAPPFPVPAVGCTEGDAPEG